LIITYAANSNAWIVRCGQEPSKLHLAPAGFRWSEDYEVWFTRNPDVADALRPQCSNRARRAIEAMRCVSPASSTRSVRHGTRLVDIFYAAGWSTWALGARRSEGVESPIGEMPLRGPLELLARRFGRLIAERLGSCELHWLPSISEVVENSEADDPWGARWHAASEPERVDLEQRAFEIAIQTVLRRSPKAAKGPLPQPSDSWNKPLSAARTARQEYAEYRARMRTYDYQMQRLAEPEERDTVSKSPSRDQGRKSATIHYLNPPLRDYRWWKGW
jgi:hypothetical protein